MNKKLPRNNEKSSGYFSPDTAHSDPVSDANTGVSEQDLAVLTMLWSRVYGRDLTQEEVMEIYRTIKHLAEIFG